MIFRAFQPLPPQCIDAKDPGNRLSVVRVPFEATFDTQGRQTYLVEKGFQGFHGYGAPPQPRAEHPLSVCILFHRGKCKSQRRCRQLHVLPKVIDQMRDEAAGPCCAEHGATGRDPWGGAQVRIAVGSGGEAIEGLTTRNFESTKGLADLVKRSADGAVVVVDADKICGLNSLRRCKWGARCINIHICREVVVPGRRKGAAREGEGGGGESDLAALGRFAASFMSCSATETATTTTSSSSSSSVSSSPPSYPSSVSSSSSSCHGHPADSEASSSPPLSPSIPPLLEEEPCW